MVCSHRCIVVTIDRTLYNVDVFKNITFKILNDTVDFNKHDINIFINDAGDNRATLQNYKATWTLLLTNEKAKSTFTRRLLRPSHPLTWALIYYTQDFHGYKRWKQKHLYIQVGIGQLAKYGQTCPCGQLY